MEYSDKTIVKPEIHYLKDILDAAYRGELRVPDFVRPFVWKPEDMLLLFESISRGYPIGSLVFWKAGVECQTYPKIGPFEFDPKSSPRPKNYIIDGHQRIATLFGILTTSPNLKQVTVPNSKYNILTASILSANITPRKYISFSAKKWKWTLYYDLRNEKFAYIKKGSPERYYIPLNSLMNTLAFLRECRRIQHECKKDAHRYIEKAENLSQSFFNYKIPVLQIKEGNLENAVEIFHRMNPKGWSRGSDQISESL